jgi:hypothetical protein
VITVVEEDADEPVTLDLSDIIEAGGSRLNIADKLPRRWADRGHPADNLSTARRPST